MRQVKLFLFSGGFVSGVNLEAASATINTWVRDNGVHLVTVSIASGHPGTFYASVIYEEADNA